MQFLRSGDLFEDEISGDACFIEDILQSSYDEIIDVIAIIDDGEFYGFSGDHVLARRLWCDIVDIKRGDKCLFAFIISIDAVFVQSGAERLFCDTEDIPSGFASLIEMFRRI